MFKCIFCALFIISIASSVLSKCPFQCDPSQCQDPKCPEGLTPMKVGCNCCETCIRVIDEGKHCFNPPPGIPIPPPPVPETCVDGFYCDRRTQTCKPKKN
ncbi:hypothetical protein AVEN_249689-1 [Araneus ventricosus]|uniref:Uncharacterized protein n=1 Tax=Araneus ventricosus TaxID=182803 RepID=A0A4Y2F4R0_ARAVE|nr:hypothetical protein AVEN_249689-1 [Araneus ventricosus]